jgi:hypothetical protein
MKPDLLLAELLHKAKAHVEAMSPTEYQAMLDEQRQSWARGQLVLIESDREWRERRK